MSINSWVLIIIILNGLIAKIFVICSTNHGRSFAQSNFETAVRFYDKDIFHTSLNIADKYGIHVQGFYHVTEDLYRWKEILEEHLMIMDGKRFQSNLFLNKNVKQKSNKLSTGWSSVFDVMDTLHIVFEGSNAAFDNITSLFSSMHIRSGSEKLNVSLFDSVRINKQLNHFSMSERHSLAEILGEMHTLNQLHSYCTDVTVNKQQRAYVFYLHNHETNCTNKIDNIKHNHSSKKKSLPRVVVAADPQESSFVHDVVNSFIVEFPGVCLSALLGGYNSCGVDFADGQYAHNVWWARCDHIATLKAFDTEKILSSLASGKYSTSSFDSLLNAVHDFLYQQQQKQQPQKLTSTSETSTAHVTELISGSSSSNNNNKKASINQQKGEHADRCAFNFNSGGKDIDNHINTVAIGNKQQHSYHSIDEDQCSRTGYRFGLIEVLSRLHDDNILFNDRHVLSNIQTVFNFGANTAANHSSVLRSCV